MPRSDIFEAYRIGWEDVRLGRPAPDPYRPTTSTGLADDPAVWYDYGRLICAEMGATHASPWRSVDRPPAAFASWPAFQAAIAERCPAYAEMRAAVERNFGFGNAKPPAGTIMTAVAARGRDAKRREARARQYAEARDMEYVSPDDKRKRAEDEELEKWER